MSRTRDATVRARAARLRAEQPSSALWGLGGLSVWALARRVHDAAWEHELLDRAGALAYFFLFSLFPGLLFLTALFGLMPVHGLMDLLMEYGGQLMPPDAVTLVRRVLEEIVAGAGGGLLSLGAAGALYAASLGVVSLMTALNVVYDVVDARPWWQRRLIAIALTFGFSLFILAVLVLLVMGPPVARLAGNILGMGPQVALLWELLSWPIVITCALVAITLGYYLAPAGPQRWHWVTPGSLFALVGWVLASFLLRSYVEMLGDFNKTYGSIGAVILLMLWFYLTAAVLLTGAEIDAEITRAAAERAEVSGRAEAEEAA